MTLRSTIVRAARTLPRVLVSPSQPAGLVLLYHRIVPLDGDPQRLAVTPNHFRQHLSVLKQSCQVMSLVELNARLCGGALPVGAVAITFDDGYGDNVEYAEPLL